MNILAATLGRFSPKYRTVAQWAAVYDGVLAREPITAKTLGNRRCHVRRIVEVLGPLSINQVRPLEIGKLIADIAAEHPVSAKRTLTELRCMLTHAVLNGWADVNHAQAIKPPRVRVARLRLSLDEYHKIYAWSRKNQPPWVHRLFLLALVSGQRRADLLKMRHGDVWDGLLHIEQQKTGARIALPLALRLPEVDATLGDVIARCRGYTRAADPDTALLIAKASGGELSWASASWRFEEAREGALGPHAGEGDPATLHELRSLSERLYRAHGLKTMDLLGHTSQDMTDLYNNDRGLSAREGRWRTLELPAE